MTLPADRARCNPQANDCACKEQCLRFTDKPPVYRPVPFCDFSIFLKDGVECEMLIKADE